MEVEIFFFYIFPFETGSHVFQSGLEPTIHLKMTLNL